MTREAIIADFEARIPDLKRAARNIAGEDADDLFQEAALMVLEMSEDRLQAAYNPTQGLKPFFIRVLLNQYRSTTSKYHRDYRKTAAFVQSHAADLVAHMETDDVEVPVIDAERVKTIRANVHTIEGKLFPCPVEELIFDLYVEKGSLRKAEAALPEELSKVVDLKRVHEVVKKYRRIIKQKIA